MIKVVCFDLGGVLVRITVDMAEAAARAGVEIDRSPGSFLDFPPFIEFQAGRQKGDDYLEQLGAWVGCPPSEALAVHNHILLDSYEGTHELIGELNQSGVLTACLSNTNAPHWHEMRQTDRFPNVRDLRLGVASHEVFLEKPQSAIYRRFEDLSSAALGAQIHASEIVFFDDTMPNVVAAQELGWQAHHIDPSRPTADQMRLHLGRLKLCAPF